MKFRITVRAMDDEAKKCLVSSGDTDKAVFNCSGCTILTTDENDRPSMTCIQHMNIDGIAETLRRSGKNIRSAVCIAKGWIDADNIMGVRKAESLFDLLKLKGLHSDGDEDDEAEEDED